MNSLNYLLQTNLYLILFMGFYMLVLRNETFFKQNRIYLNGSVLLSFIIPFINSDWFRELFITRKVREATIPLQVIYDPVVVQVTEQAPKWTIADAMMWIYLTGVSVFLIRFIIQLIGIKYNLTAIRGSAFSFFKKLVIDADLPERATIINHEEVHIRQWHSLDVLFIELAAVLNWFNPVIYIYKKEIKHIHEFIADEEAAGTSRNKSDYALLLLSNTMGVSPHQLTNSFFNQSLLKRRVMMLSKNRSRRTGLLKYGLSAPLFASMLIFSAATAKSEKTVLLAESKRITSSLVSTLNASQESIDYQTFLKRNSTVKDLAWKIKPYRVIVYLKNGMKETYNFENSGEKKEAEKKYGEFPYPPPPPPIPAKPKTDKIKSPTPPPVPLKPEMKKGNALIESDTNKILDFSHVERLPEFPGGEKGFGTYLSKSIRYPVEARKNNISGRVFVTFVVEKDGTLSGIKVLRGLGYGTDEEAVRVINDSPKWLPGMAKGQPVRVQYTIPIQFLMRKTDDSKSQVPALPPNALYRVDGKKRPQDYLLFVNGNETQVEDFKKINTVNIKSIKRLEKEKAIEKFGKSGDNGVLEITTDNMAPK